MKVNLIGVGLGNPDTMTLEARAAIERSGALIGAERLLAGQKGKKTYALIAPEKIAEAVRGCGCGEVSVLLSGDVGFYSGAARLYEQLSFAEICVIPGVSSLVYFCARLKTPWQDVFCVSAHGRRHNAVGEIQRHGRTFVLTGGSYRASDLIAELCDRRLGHVSVHVGQRLSYPDERIVSGTALSLVDEHFDSLAVVLVENPAPILRPFGAPSLMDDDFIRLKTPMTKQEVRALSIAKLHIAPEHTVWDVGAGTGSVTVEAAFAASAGRVFAIERSSDAARLIECNREQFGLTNVEIICAGAPEALELLPPPDRVFIGGSGGNMEGILRICLEKNPQVRVVANAVTLETLSELTGCFARLGLDDTDMVQVAATRTRRAGNYHLMDAQNPVWILSGEVHRDRA